MLFVTFKIKSGDSEYFEHSWFNNYSIAHYEDAKSITDKDMIEQTYTEGRSTEDFEENFNEETNVYTDFDDDTIAVHRVQEMTEKELDVLVKMGVLYR
jgi:hypothetical protein